jgi:hypothetical protein
MFWATAFALSTMFWHNLAKCCCHKKHQTISTQKLLCYGAKNVEEIKVWCYSDLY